MTWKNKKKTLLGKGCLSDQRLHREVGEASERFMVRWHEEEADRSGGCAMQQKIQDRW